MVALQSITVCVCNVACDACIEAFAVCVSVCRQSCGNPPQRKLQFSLLLSAIVTIGASLVAHGNARAHVLGFFRFDHRAAFRIE